MNNIHTCSYSCDRPECIKAQRDELAAAAAQEAVAWQRRYIGATRGARPVEWHNITKDELEATKAGKWADRYEVRALYAAPVSAEPGIDRELLRDLIDYAESGKVAEPSMVERMRACLDASPKGALNELFGSAE